jgi:hypothetical protein
MLGHRYISFTLSIHRYDMHLHQYGTTKRSGRVRAAVVYGQANSQ